MLQEMIYDFLNVVLPDYYHIYMTEKIVLGEYTTVFSTAYYSRSNTKRYTKEVALPKQLIDKAYKDTEYATRLCLMVYKELK